MSITRAIVEPIIKRGFSAKVAFKLRHECEGQRSESSQQRPVSSKSPGGNKGTLGQVPAEARVTMLLWAGEGSVGESILALSEGFGFYLV